MYEEELNNLKMMVCRYLHALEWPSPYDSIDDIIDIAKRNSKKWVLIASILQKIRAIELARRPPNAYRKIPTTRQEVVSP